MFACNERRCNLEVEGRWPQSPVDIFTGLMINLNFTVPKTSSSSYWCRGDEIWYAALVALLFFASLVYLISSKKKARTRNAQLTTEVAIDDEEISSKPATREDTNETTLEADAKYAKELYAEELLAFQETNMNASLEECEICLEKQESWQMFRNSTCSHSFCYNCTTKHATTKIQQKNATVTCPGINCKSTLDFDALREIIPNETLIKWDELLCESMIPESQKIYCPFANCSVLLINDDVNNNVPQVDCPLCRRSFCASCRVPWHSELSCKEFGKVKEAKDDDLIALAKKKRWKKCPHCGFFVEKTEGCSTIICRCTHQFCYTCGDKYNWSDHINCR